MAEATMQEVERCCTGTTTDGSPCTVTFALNDTPDGPRCLSHDESRADRVREGQQRSLETRAAKAERRHGAPEGMPEGTPKTNDDAVRWAGWLALATATGAIDNRAAEVINKSLATLQAALAKRDTERELRKLRRQIRELRKNSGGLRR